MAKEQEWYELSEIPVYSNKLLMSRKNEQFDYFKLL